MKPENKFMDNISLRLQKEEFALKEARDANYNQQVILARCKALSIGIDSIELATLHSKFPKFYQMSNDIATSVIIAFAVGRASGANS